MRRATVTSQDNDITPDTLGFYRGVLKTLNNASLPYLLGGAYALNHYTGINRHTEDLDIFIARDDYDRISQCLTEAGYTTELTYPHWLGKIHCNGEFIDLVFSSGNGIATVDEQWFEHAQSTEVFGIPTQLCPVEETIWSKAYIMERERFDGADVAHLIVACGDALDWQRLVRRFGEHWRLLLSHLSLFGLIYPADRHLIPAWVMDELAGKITKETHEPAPDKDICGGTLLSREQYLNDLQGWGYKDARVRPHGNMTEQDTATWTAAIKTK